MEKKFKLSNMQLFANPAGEGNLNEDPTPTEETVSKELFDKTSTELARYKKLYNEKLTDEEKANNEKQGLLDELDTLRKEKKHSSIVAGLSKTGFDDKLIDDIASAIINDDIDSLTKSINKGIKDVLKVKDDEINRLKLETVEHPKGQGDEPKTLTRADVMKMSADERQKIFEKNPELLKSLYE